MVNQAAMIAAAKIKLADFFKVEKTDVEFKYEVLSTQEEASGIINPIWGSLHFVVTKSDNRLIRPKADILFDKTAKLYGWNDLGPATQQLFAVKPNLADKIQAKAVAWAKNTLSAKHVIVTGADQAEKTCEITAYIESAGTVSAKSYIVYIEGDKTEGKEIA